MSKYQVIVGNIGTVHDGSDQAAAVVVYNDYVNRSIHGISTRAAGEAVTLMEHGEPIMEHQGYQYMYEQHPEWELQNLVAERRKDDGAHCPVCPAELDLRWMCGVDGAKTVLTDDNKDYRIHIRRQCSGCGFVWHDVMRTVGATLENNQLTENFRCHDTK